MGFQAFTPPDNIIGILLIRRLISGFQLFRLASVWLFILIWTQQLMSCLGTAIVDNITSLQGPDRGIIPLSGV